MAYGDTLVANDSTIFVSKSLDDEPLEVYDPAQLREYKYMKIVPKYDAEINFDANGDTGTMTDVEVAAATEYELPENDFIAPEGKQFKNLEVDGTAMNPGDKIFLIEDFTGKAIREDISHTCNIEPGERVWPDCEKGGKEAYYKCDVCAYNAGLLAPPADPDNPQTGDNTQLGMWFALMLISVCGLVVVPFLGTQKKGKHSH